MSHQPSAGRREIAGRSIRWSEERAKQAYENGHWVKSTLAQALATEAKTNPERVILAEGDIRLSASELYGKAEQLARNLANRFATGSVVSFMLPNWHETAIIYLASTIAGMIAHPVLPSLREHDLRYMLSDVDSQMIFIPEQFRNHQCADMLARVVETLDNPPEVVVVRGDHPTHIPFESLFDSTNLPLPEPPDPDSVRMIMYTSGTTGSPKGVMHSHNSIHALIQQLGNHWLIEPGDKFLVASPISHIGGSIYAFEIPILLGATAVLMEQWQPDAGIELLIQEQITHFAGATPFLVSALDAARKAGSNLPDLKVFICGGASVPPSLIREAADYFAKAAVTRAYGSTEVPVMSVGVTDRNDVEHAAETDGRPGIAHLRLDGADDKGIGEVVALGPQMLVGYVHADDEAKVFTDDGYYRTGDLGRWIDNDYLVIAGRLKDIIIRNGENIAPKEIEDLLVNHADIKEIAIVGLPDAKTGERACAVIVPEPGKSPTVADLAEFLIAKGVAKFKIPELVELRDSLLKNDAGKVLKHKIQAEITGA